MPRTSTPFSKMHGLGNDFVVIDAVSSPIDFKTLPIARLADRHAGIGFDQLLLIEPSKKADFFCRILNADGSEAEQCGNGLRCVARYAHENSLHEASAMRIETAAGIFPVQIDDYDHIRVTMGAPASAITSVTLSVPACAQPIAGYELSMGNPHYIIPVKNLDETLVREIGSDIAAHSHFPHGANVGFLQIINPQRARLRTYERGAGETHACGSNACAAAAIGMQNGWLDPSVTLVFRHGTLLIEWEGKQSPIHMTGPAAMVFRGEFTI